MTAAIGTSPLPPMSIPSTMPSESVSTANSEPEANSTLSLGSKSYSLLYIPSELALYVSRTDDALLRLNKLLTTTTSLEYLLSTTNYICYLLTFLYAHYPSRSKLTQLLSRFLIHPRTPSKPRSPDPPSTPSNLAHLTSLLTNTRTNLRLTALVPLYVSLRTLLLRPTSDPYLHAIALTQCLSYILYQAVENIAHLIDLHIIPASLINTRWNPLRSSESSTARLWLISSRFWLAGASCEILRLLREAYIEAQRRRRHSTLTEIESERNKSTITPVEAAETDRRWWRELFVAGCWLPMCAHYSVEGGLFRSSIEDGVVGALGLAASWEGWRAAWAETKG